MGLAILGVIISHLAYWTGIPWLPKMVLPFTGLIHTEGFLFLSGYGLYFSFYKNRDVVYFYIKRLNRLVVPSILLTIGFYLFYLIIGKDSVCDFILGITFIDFFVYGNVKSMWYISISILLYFLFPLLWKLIVNKGKEIPHFVGVITFWFIGLYMMSSLIPQYYDMVYIGVSKTPSFLFGMMSGYLALRNTKVPAGIFFVCFFFIVIGLYTIENSFSIVEVIAGNIGKVFCIFLITYVFSQFKSLFSLCSPLLDWFGRYTLELYILHLQIWALLIFLCDMFGIFLNVMVIPLASVFFSLLLASRLHSICNKVVKTIGL